MPSGKLTTLFARRSESCPVCRTARRKQEGFAFWVVKTFENVCPFCRCYEKVHRRKSHEPLPSGGGDGSSPEVLQPSVSAENRNSHSP
jgi:hypothetical protein